METENCRSASARWVVNKSSMGVVSGVQGVPLTRDISKYRLAQGKYKEFLQASLQDLRVRCKQLDRDKVSGKLLD